MPSTDDRKQRNRRLLLAATLAAMIAVTILVVRGRSPAGDGEILQLLERAESIVRSARADGSFGYAEPQFERAVLAIVGAREALRERGPGVAAPLAETALEHTRLARDSAAEAKRGRRAAMLEWVKNEVRHRPSDDLAWSDASAGMRLFHGDRIGTGKGSQAMLRFDDQTDVHVAEKTVLVVERVHETAGADELQLGFSVSSGRVRSLFQRRGQRNVKAGLSLPHADIVVDTADGVIEIGTEVFDDSSARVTVYRGAVSLATEGGETTVLDERSVAEVSSSGAKELRRMPPVPVDVVPRSGATIVTSAARPRANVNWSTREPCALVRVELARDAAFVDSVLEVAVRSTNSAELMFKPGRYFLRLSCFDRRGAQGPFSETSRFEVVRDDVAPELEILERTTRRVGVGWYEASCRSEEGATVSIDGESVEVAHDGVFRRLVALSPGVNRIEFRAVDRAGNVTTEYRSVTRPVNR